MHHLNDYSDERLRGACTHCDVGLGRTPTNRDHVPTRALLVRPYPDFLPVVEICQSCNSSFAANELYFTMFVDAVVLGTCDPAAITDPVVRGRFTKHRSTAARIAAARGVSDDGSITWAPDMDAVATVLVKNARGHVLHELGEPCSDRPRTVSATPLASLSTDERPRFEAGSDHAVNLWPEVGSRMMTRLVEGTDMDRNGWIHVQAGRYRYRLDWVGRIAVQTVIREYLATEVVWDG